MINLTQILIICALIHQSYQGLRSLPGANKVLIGSIATTGFDDPFNKDGDGGKYKKILNEEFNLIGAENEFKPYGWSGTKNPNSRDAKDAIVDTSNADKIAEFARSHNQKVRGHVLVYFQVVPQWLKQGVDNGQYSNSQVENMLCQYVKYMVGRYKGKIQYWDVINEIFDGNGNVQHDFWWQHLGQTDTYFGKIFQWAHETDPNVGLFYNDFSNEEQNAKSQGILKILTTLKSQGIQIHGIGLQSHMSTDRLPNIDSIRKNVKQMATHGLKFQITEFDCWTHKDKPDFEKQRQIYKSMMNVCLTESNCEAFVMWGYTDKYSWLDQFVKSQNGGDGLIFDRNYNKKPAYTALQQELSVSKIAIRNIEVE